MSNKVIDIANTLNLINDYNTSGTTSNARISANSNGQLTVHSTQSSTNSSTAALILLNGGLSINITSGSSSFTQGGALTVLGGASVAGTSYLNNIISTLITSTNTIVTNSSVSSLNTTSITSASAFVTNQNSTNITVSTLNATTGITSASAQITNQNSTNITVGTINVSTGISSGRLYVLSNGSSINDYGMVALENTGGNGISFGYDTTINRGWIYSRTVGVAGTPLSINNLLYVQNVAGNVGIGNSSPTTSLDITGTLKTSSSATIPTLLVTNQNSTNITVGSINSTIGITTGNSLVIGTLNVLNTSGISLISRNNTGDVLQIQNSNGSGYSTVQYLDSSGSQKMFFGYGNTGGNTGYANVGYLLTSTSVPFKIITGPNGEASSVVFNASDNSVSIKTTTNASDTSSGALQISGGFSVVKDSFFGGLLNATNSIITNQSVSSINVSTGITSTSALITNQSSTNLVVTNLTASNFLLPPNILTTNITVGTINATTGITSASALITNQNSTNITVGTINATTGITSASALVTNQNSTNITVGTINATTGITSASALITNQNSTNITVGTINASTGITSASALITNGTISTLRSTNFTSAGLSTDYINFNAPLLIDISGWWYIGRFNGGGSGQNCHIELVGGGGYNGLPNQHASSIIHIRNGNSAGQNASVTYSRFGLSQVTSNVILSSVSTGNTSTAQSWDIYAELPSFVGRPIIKILNGQNSSFTKTLTSMGSVTMTTDGSITFSASEYFGVNSPSYFLGNIGVNNSSPSSTVDITGTLRTSSSATIPTLLVTNQNVTNITVGTLNATSALITNQNSTNISAATINISTGITSATALITNQNSTNITVGTLNVSTGITSASAQITNQISTNITVGTLNATTGITSASALITNQNSTNITVGTINISTGITSATALITNQNSTNISAATINISTGITSATAQITNQSSTNISTATINATTGITSASALITNQNSTNISAATINISTGITSATAQITNQSSTNISTATINATTGITSASALITNQNSTNITSATALITNQNSTNITVSTLNVSTITTSTINVTGDASLASILRFKASSFLGHNTSDGSDDRYTILSGGGSDGANRGGRIVLSGNERIGFGGDVQIFAGTNGNIEFFTNGDNIRGSFDVNGLFALQNGLSVTSSTISNQNSTNISTATINVSTGITSATAQITHQNSTNISTATINISTGITSATALITNQSSTNITVGTLNVSTGITSGSSLITNLTVSNSLLVSTGNVGIGKSSPNSRLHIHSNASSLTDYGMFSVENTGGSGLSLGHDLTNNWSWLYSRTVGVAGTTINMNNLLFVQNAAGYVGINTSSPSYRLHVNGTFQVYNNTNGGNTNLFTNSDSGSSAYSILGLTNNIGGAYSFLNSSTRTADGGPNVWTMRNDVGHLRLQAASAVTVFLNTNGNVGIATTSPSTTLDVSGTFKTSSSATIPTLLVTNQNSTNITASTLNASTGITSSSALTTYISTGSIVSDFINFTFLPTFETVGDWWYLGRFTGAGGGHTCQLELIGGSGFNGDPSQHGGSIIHIRNGNGGGQNASLTYSRYGKSNILSNVILSSISTGNITAAASWDLYANLTASIGRPILKILCSKNVTFTKTVTSMGSVTMTTDGSITFSGSEYFATNSPNYFLGNVGIGNTSPTTTLDITGTLKTTSFTNLSFNSNTIGSIITTGGSVGIGTNSPQHRLDINTTPIVNSVEVQVRNTAFTSSNLRLGVPSAADVIITNALTGGSVIANDYGPLQFGAGSTTVGSAVGYMIIQTGGNVGIGNTSPTSTLHITGSLAKSSGTFDIQHPLFPEKRLIHSFIEGPRCDLIYRGTVNLINGSAIVNIDSDCVYESDCKMSDGTFVALCRNPVKYLHNNDSFDRIRGSISGNILTIVSENNSSTDSVDWMIIAERNDSSIISWNKTNSNGYLKTEY